MVAVHPTARPSVRRASAGRLGYVLQATNVSYEEYHPYGTTAWWTDRGSTVSQKRYRYTGKEKDEESGLYYHRARYYAPWLARWVRPDPAGLADGPNAYCYVRGRPTRLADEKGLAGREPEWSAPQQNSEGTWYQVRELEAVVEATALDVSTERTVIQEHATAKDSAELDRLFETFLAFVVAADRSWSDQESASGQNFDCVVRVRWLVPWHGIDRQQQSLMAPDRFNLSLNRPPTPRTSGW